MAVPFFLQNNPSPNQFQEVLEYWDAQYGVTSSAERVSAWSGMRNLYSLDQASGAAQPILLPYAGVNYCWNDGVASNTITCPTVSMTGNLTFSLDQAEDDYTPSGNITLVSKLSGNNGFELLLLTTGVLRLRIGDGASVTNVDSTVAVGTTDQTRHTFGIVWTDGVGASFTVDGVALGTAVAAVKTLTNAAVSLTIGPWNGKHYGLTITNGVSTTYYNSTTSGATEGAATYSSNGQTYTVNASGAKPAQIVGSQQILGDGAHWMATGAFATSGGVTAVVLVKANVWASADYLLDGVTTNTLALNQGGVTPQWAYQTAQCLNGDLALGTYGIIGAIHNAASSSIQINLGTPVTGSHGAGTSLGGLTLFTYGGSGGAGNVIAAQVKAIALCNSVLSATRLNQLIRAMAAQSGVAL